MGVFPFLKMLLELVDHTDPASWWFLFYERQPGNCVTKTPASDLRSSLRGV